MAALSLPVGIHTYLMIRVLGALSSLHGRSAAGFCDTADCSAITGVVIMHQLLDIVLNLLSYRYNGIPGSCQHIVYQLFLILHYLPGALTH